ncbi:menaquinol oxidoreductase [Dissulfurirhabdus thermomarina]|uniref:Menaquinol oxidoreductase n=1 Tax=Dissulfurirhabdus thermomarina TaxID=1765737 RepID=A0A6N9TPE1_DISTH|nr:sulfate reduction electron transfer complex DsrMKJOP subunit DsrM [Dissulfurirhabdus thermomarina]NDY43141.1 menaquinol oxidoreductase [Dissulfurirhabdus thermomarina]NMX23991.1 sulfate reduction electron transfer complex DsrMKJOP subunit DsrM [Dissulfurirhabdus thermomarina]
MTALYSLLAVLVLALVAYLGAEAGLHTLFGVVIPYAAFLLFVGGFIWRVVRWGKSPVPFRIPTTCGQEKSLPWIKQNKFDNPSTTGGVIVRMLLEAFLFRSLFRNTKARLQDGNLVYRWTRWLWLFGLMFHVSFLVIFVRHFRLLTQPVPGFVQFLDALDGMFQIGAPQLYITDVLILTGLTFLLLRRFFIPQVRYISLANDYFPLFLLLGVAVTGVLMRYFSRVDVVGIKELAVGLASLHPTVPQGLQSLFFVHLFLVSVLVAYFPFSKLMHMGGVFLSPTRNLANNSRMKRHINPWNYPVKVHSYEAYEDEFRELMKQAGIPVEKE